MQTSYRRNLVGIAMMFLGAILFSMKAIMVKISYQHHVDAPTLLSLRMIFSFPFFAIVAWLTNSKRPQKVISLKEWGQVIFLGIIGYYLASIFDFEGLQYVTAGTERLILFVYPTLVVVLSAFFYKRPFHKMEIIALLLTYLGIVIVYLHDVSGKSNDVNMGVMFIFLSALTYAVYLVGSGSMIPKFGSMNYTAWAMIVSTAATLFHNIFFSQHHLLKLETEVYWLALAMAVFSTVIPGFMVSEAIRMIGSSRSAIIASVGPVSTIILAKIFLNESFTWYQFIGTIFVMAGVLLVSVKKNVPEKIS